MKIFAYLCAFLSLFQIAAAAVSPENLHYYVDITTEINQLIANVSTYILDVNQQVQNMTEDFNRNISSFLTRYGNETHQHFQRKYGPKAAEFAENPKSHKDCPKYISDLLKDSEKHQKELSEYVATAVESCRKGFMYLTQEFDIATTVLTKVQKNTYNCSTLLTAADQTAAYNCAILNLDILKILQADLTEAVNNEAKSLVGVKERALKKLHNSVDDRFISSFYDENGIDSWLKVFCPVGQKTADHSPVITKKNCIR